MNKRAGPPGASSAFGWSLINTIASRLATVGIGIALARLLGPESFGTFAVALVALMAVLSFNELGVSLAIVRWPGDPAKIVPTVNTISVAASAVFCVGAMFAAPVFTAAMGDPDATQVVRVLILSVFINGVVASPAALLQRAFREKTRLGIDQVNVWVGAVLSLILAAAGMGAMALALGRVAGSLLAGAMFLAASPLPYRFGMDRAHLGHLLRFGLPLAGTSIIFFGVGYADQLTAGVVLGSTALAFYALAFNLASWPVSILAQPLRRVAPAAFSALQQDKAGMKASVVSMIAVLAAAAFPPVSFLAGAAVPIVIFVYGEAWQPAGAVLAWLVVAAAGKIICDLSYDYLVVCGKSGTVLIIQAGSLLVLCPALAAGAMWNGLAGLAAAQALVAGFVVLPLYLWRLSRHGVAIGAIFSSTWISVVVSAVVGCLTFSLVSTSPNGLWPLLAGGCLCAAASVLLLFLRRAELRGLRDVGRVSTDEAVELVP